MIKLTDEQCCEIDWQTKIVANFIGFMRDGAKKGEINKSTGSDGMALLDIALQKLCDVFNYEHVLAKKHAKWDKKIQDLESENKALRRQCGMKVSLEDWRERTKIVFKALERWVNSTGLSIGGSEISNQGLLNICIHTKYIRIGRDGKPGRKAVIERGFELVKSDFDMYAALANTTDNFRLLHEMVAELSPYATIMKIECLGLFIEHVEVMLEEVDCLQPYTEENNK